MPGNGSWAWAGCCPAPRGRGRAWRRAGAFTWQGDPIRTTSGPLHPDPHGQEVTDVTDAHVLGRLFDVLADITDYIEWPTFVLFFCGC